MPTVETVLGPIDDSQLGFALSHEHVRPGADIDGVYYPWMFDREATMANLVQELSDRSPDQIADIFVREIETGIGDSGLTPGAIKVANDAGGITAESELMLCEAARALERSGCPISTHHRAPEQVGLRQVEIFREEGAPMDRICIDHGADTTDVDYVEALLKSGVYLSMDRYPGREGRPNWEQRNATVQALVDRGWVERLILGHDWGPPPVRAGSEPPDGSEPTRYLFVSTVSLPALGEAGVSEDDIDIMMRDVPRRFLTGARVVLTEECELKHGGRQQRQSPIAGSQRHRDGLCSSRN